eukprot:scaffold20407_cov192-Isochrysis_galbana.AAC.2
MRRQYALARAWLDGDDQLPLHSTHGCSAGAGRARSHLLVFGLPQRARHGHLRRKGERGGSLGFNLTRAQLRVSIHPLHAHRGLVRHLRRGGERGGGLGARGGGRGPGPVRLCVPEQHGVCLQLHGAALVSVRSGQRRQRSLVPGLRRGPAPEGALRLRLALARRARLCAAGASRGGISRTCRARTWRLVWS